METDIELVNRYEHVRKLIKNALRSMNRKKAGVGRDRTARWAGSLSFTKGQIESKLRERGLLS